MSGAALAAAPGGGKQNGIYLRAFGGLAHQEESRVNGTNVSDGNLELDPAAGLGGAIGYRWGTLRLEGFGSWRHHDVDVFEALQLVTRNETTGATVTINNVNRFRGRVGGDSTTIAALVNGIVDIDFNLPVVPFVGAGLGAAYVSLNDVRGNAGGVPFELTDDSDMVLAYQALAGAAFPVTPQITVETQYRFLTMTDPEFTDSLG
ncbi:MAG: outer membrane protein, partial [Kiloniellales bacterium]